MKPKPRGIPINNGIQQIPATQKEIAKAIFRISDKKIPEPGRDRRMTNEERARIDNETLLEYSACVRRIGCIKRKLEKTGSPLEEIGKILRTVPERLRLGKYGAPTIIIPMIASSDEKDEKRVGEKEFDFPEIVRLLNDLQENLSKKSDLEKALQKTEHAHLISP